VLTRPSPVSVPDHEAGWVLTAQEVASSAAADAAAGDVSGDLPLSHLRALADSGLDAALLPVEHGGQGLSCTAVGAVVGVLAVAHPALATVWLMHVGAAHALVTLSTPEAAAHFAAELVAGRRFANALSEPAGGSFFLTSQQDATRDTDGWSFTGRKLFVSGAEVAHHLLLNVRIDGQPAFFGVTVDDTVSLPPIEPTAGMRATRSRSLVFAGTALAASRRCAPPTPEQASRISVAFPFLSLGIAEAALDALTSHAARRAVAPGSDQVLADAQWVRMETGLVWTQLRAARLLAEQTCWLADRGDPAALACAVEAKLLANEVAKQAAALAVRVCGGAGYLESSPVQRIFRDAQAGALMAYNSPFSSEVVGGWVLGRG